uniref:Uncharacterized protein n=1 Tax=Picea glauca TaxID=3330 RepID=A0A101M0Y7_PICGL|nr:hypothetical protein ABT39_MTgene4343 [Picea glauca]QHR88469.1 hypothetical protein Q903MT_gene2483 [Picea sitchensis]
MTRIMSLLNPRLTLMPAAPRGTASLPLPLVECFGREREQSLKISVDPSFNASLPFPSLSLFMLQSFH